MLKLFKSLEVCVWLQYTECLLGQSLDNQWLDILINDFMPYDTAFFFLLQKCSQPKTIWIEVPSRQGHTPIVTIIGIWANTKLNQYNYLQHSIFLCLNWCKHYIHLFYRNMFCSISTIWTGVETFFIQQSYPSQKHFEASSKKRDASILSLWSNPVSINQSFKKLVLSQLVLKILFRNVK